MSTRAIQPRIAILMLGSLGVTVLILLRLFYLQIIAHGYYAEIARTERYGTTRLPARRGEILLQDNKSDEYYKIGTNTTLNMIYADPIGIKNPQLVADTLAPLLFDLEQAQERDEDRIEKETLDAQKIENPELREVALARIQPKSEEDLGKEYRQELEDALAKRTRDVILLAEKIDLQTQEKLKGLNLQGVEINDLGDVYAYPAQISDKASTATALAEALDGDATTLKSTLEGKNHYIELKHRLDPKVSDQIKEILDADRKDPDGKAGPQEAPLDFLGIRLKEEYFRYYPEETLAAQVLGYVNSANEGQYGIEGTFDEILRGKDGIFSSQIDTYKRQITIGDSTIEEAENGANIVLTLDRAIQLQVERFLEEGVKNSRADSGQALVINPKTGEILAMAEYPTYNPNNYGEVFKKRRIEFTEDEKKRIFIKGTAEKPIYWFYKQVDPDVRIQIFPDEENPEQWWAYENDVGPEVYKMKPLQETYEPGSVFKPIVMSMALDAGEVTPKTTFNDSGPVPVDLNSITGEYDFYINTFNNKYFGIMNMTNVLEKSSNTGMTFVVRKLGAALFYNYLKTFGFLDRTEIGLDNEVQGKVSHYTTWRAESEMITKAFGQGISMSMLQLAQAYTALSNEGEMMRLRLIKEIQYPDGHVETFEPETVRQVIKPETARTITAMMTSVMEGYVSVKLANHYVAGKTGTAQTYKGGIALSGAGTTIATVVGFGPVDDPQFLVLVKMDRPHTIEWAESTSGPVFHKIMDFLYTYYSIPPDKE